jgi:hypothetical protein
MVETETLEDAIIKAILKTPGILEVTPFLSPDRSRIMEIEKEAERKSLMGLGKVANTGVKDILDCNLIYVALTDMKFDWGCHPALVLKKGSEVVGEEIRDKGVLAKLSKQEDVWFMHENFVIYKDKMSFPHDIMSKTCQFETPSLPAEWCVLEDKRYRCQSIIYANPTPPCDLFLKERYFTGSSGKGLGTILVGVKF